MGLIWGVVCGGCFGFVLLVVLLCLVDYLWVCCREFVRIGGFWVLGFVFAFFWLCLLVDPVGFSVICFEFGGWFRLGVFFCVT